MYSIRYVPIALDDLEQMLDYIGGYLKNPDAAKDMLDHIDRAILHLREYPYSHPLYMMPLRQGTEFRCVPVKNYLVLYTVIEPQHIVEVRRMLYGKIDTGRQII